MKNRLQPRMLFVLGERLTTNEAASEALELAGVDFATICSYQGRDMTIPVDGSRFTAERNGPEALALHDLWLALWQRHPVYRDSPSDPWLARSQAHHEAAVAAGEADPACPPSVISGALAAALLVYNAEVAAGVAPARGLPVPA